MRGGNRISQLLLFLFIILPAIRAGASGQTLELNGYAEWRTGGFLIVDGQRVFATNATKFKSHDAAKSFATIPLGYEVKVKGARQPDGSVLAGEVEAKVNGDAMFEAELKQSFDEMEKEYRAKGYMFEPLDNGKVENIGTLEVSGPQVDRVRRITARIVPPYLKPSEFHVYVVDNKDWNAMAAPNRSIYVYSGLLQDMDDDEVAIVLGHELVHATYEHSRREYKSSLWIQLAAIGAIGVTEGTVDDEKAKLIIEITTALAMSAWSNGYSRHYEDQADRVGLRYAYQGGFAVQKGPRLWGRFADKYGNPNKTVNFFFGDHSVAKDRQRNLEKEMQMNYQQGTVSAR